MGAVLRRSAGRRRMTRETAYRGYRIEFTSYEVLKAPAGWVAAAVVEWGSRLERREVIFDRDEPRRFQSLEVADDHALELAKAWIDRRGN
jgi:hypothetical protein